MQETEDAFANSFPSSGAPTTRIGGQIWKARLADSAKEWKMALKWASRR
jgi:hypothetical protein